MKSVYIHKSIRLGILGVSVYILGFKKFSLRFELSWGWEQ